MKRQLTLRSLRSIQVKKDGSGSFLRGVRRYRPLFKIALSLFVLLSYNSLYAQQPPALDWVVTGGGTSTDHGYEVATDKDGNVYTIGVFSASISFGTNTFTSKGGYDTYVTKQDDQGNFIWAKSFGSSANDLGTGLSLDDSGNVYIAGTFGSTPSSVTMTMGAFTLTAPYYESVFMAKLSGQQGDVIWAKKLTASGSRLYGKSIAADKTGNIYVLGYYYVQVNFDPDGGTHTPTSTIKTNGGYDGYVFKLDSTGAFQWVTNLGGSYTYDYCHYVKVDHAGHPYVSGRFGTVNFGGTALQAKGTTENFIARLDPKDGSFIWAIQAGGVNKNSYAGGTSASLAFDKDDNVYAAGIFQGAGVFGGVNLQSGGGVNGWVGKIDPNNGKFLWATLLGKSADASAASAVAVDNSGNVYTYGSFGGTAQFGSTTLTAAAQPGSDLFFAMLDPQGNVLGALPLKATGNPTTTPASTAMTFAQADNSIYVTGGYVGTTDFDLTGTNPSTYTVKDGRDAFLAKYQLPSSATIDIAKLDPQPKYCLNSPVTVAYTATGTYNSGNIFTAQLSDENGDFTNATDIGTLSGTAATGTIDAKIPGNATGGSAYRIRVVSSNPAVTGNDNGTDLTVDKSVDVDKFGISSNPSPPEICEGEEVTLAGGYSDPTFLRAQFIWDNGVTNNKPFAPTATQTYTLTATLGGCSKTLQVTVTVKPGPKVTAAANPDEVCAGAQTVLTEGGNAKSYSWDNGVTSGAPFTPKATQTYTVNGTAANGCTDTAQVSVTVNPLPTVTATANPGTDICEGHEVTLNGSGADTYSWDKNVTDGKAFVPKQTETYTVIGTDANGCADTTDITVNVKDTAIVAVADTICFGDTYTLGTQTLDKTGTYKEVFVASNGCDSTVNLSLTVNTVDLSIAQNGNELKATDGATSYQWLDCNNGKQPIPGATKQAYSSDVAGDFAVVVTSGDCTDTSVCYHIVGVPKGIHGANFSHQVTLYPNPNNGQMTIASGYTLTNATVRVINIVGQAVKEINHISGNSFKVDINQYAAGIYYIEIRDGAQTARLKFTKE